MRKRIHLRQSGSGLNLTLFAGAAQAFEDRKIEFETIAGTSGGGIVGACLASGMTAKEIKSLLLQFMPPALKIMDLAFPPGLALPLRWGLFKGDKLTKELRKYVGRSFDDTHVPFACFTTDMNSKQSVEWSTHKTPDAPLADRAVDGGRLPIVFTPAWILGQPHRDGGLADNYPIDYKFPDQDDSIPTIGLCFQSTVGKPSRIKSIEDDLMGCLDMLLVATTRKHIEDANWARTILLEPAGSSLDFMKSREAAEEDFKAGYTSVIKWLDENSDKIFR